MKRTPVSSLLVAVAWLVLGVQVVADITGRFQAISALPGLYAFHLALVGLVVLGASCAAGLVEGSRPSWRVLGALAATGAVALGRVATSTTEPSMTLLAPLLLVAPGLLTLELVAVVRAGMRPGLDDLRRFAVAWSTTAAAFVVAVCAGHGQVDGVIVRPVELSTAGWSLVLVGLAGLAASAIGRRLASCARFAVVALGGFVIAAAAGSDAARAPWAMSGPTLDVALLVLAALATALPWRILTSSKVAVSGRAFAARSTRAAGSGVASGGRAAAQGGARATAATAHAGRRARRRLLAALAPAPVPHRRLTRNGQIAAGLMAAGTVAIVVHAIWWAERVGWEPTGHSATVMARSFDVGTANHPWAGMATSAGASGGASHPGPMLFDLLAPLVRLFGVQHGAFLGGALMALVCWAVAVWAAWRVAGGAIAVVTWVGGALVLEVAALGAVWETNNVSPTMLAMFATLLASWAASAGVWRAWWWAVALGTLCVQAYMVNGVLILGPVLAAGLVLVAAGRVAAGDEDRRRARQAWRWGLVIGAVLWLQPVLDIVLHDGGNARDLSGLAGDLREPVGITGFPKAIAWMCSLPPYWRRISRTFADGGPASSFLEGPYLIGGLVAVIIAVVWIGTWRRASSTERRIRIFTLMVVAAAGFNATQLPSDFVRAFTMGWLVFASLCVWWAVAVTVAFAGQRWAASGAGLPEARRSALVRVGFGLAALAVLVTVITGPRTIADMKGEAFTTDAMIAPVVDQTLDNLRADGDVLVIPLDSDLSEVSTDSITSNLIVRGVPVRIEAGTDNHYGDHRTVPGRWGGSMLWFTTSIPPVTPDGRLVARATQPGWTQAHLDDVAAQVGEAARANGPITLSSAADSTLVRYFAGWYGPDTCEVVARVRAGTFPLDTLPDSLLLSLYADRAVASPVLPPSLQDDAQVVVGQAPIEVWEVDRDAERPIANENLLRDGTACAAP